MRQNPDEEIVSSWIEPLALGEMLSALRGAGFSGDVYRDSSADLGALLEDDKAGALHFLRHGYAEGRVFRTGLDMAGLGRLQRLPLRNRFYLRNLMVALVAAWAGSTIRSTAELAAHAATIEHLRTMGGVPVLIFGDAAAGLYRRGACLGERWLLPLAMMPFQGGVEELRRTPMAKLMVPDMVGPAIPTIWKFGQSEMQEGYLAHRLRQGIAANDHDAFLGFAAASIENYASFLAAVVARTQRRAHWIAGLFPPVWLGHEPAPPSLIETFGEDVLERLAYIGADSLPARTAMHHAFNLRLEQAVMPLGFNMVQDFESMLTPNGVIDEHYLVPLRDSTAPDYRSCGGILSATLWSIANAGVAPAAPAPAIRDQFQSLLDEIRLVQMGEFSPPRGVPG